MRKVFLVSLINLITYLPLFAQTDTAWVRTYSGPYGEDWATNIAVDKSGNVYVSGRSRRSQNGFEYATIKYYPNGDTAWVRRYCGHCSTVNRSAGTNDLAIDDSGNVYVTGFSPDTVFGRCYATIKYYSNGDTAWIRRYGKEYDNVGVSIAVDDSLNVYVTGASSGTGMYDYGTIKYYPNGDTAWVRIYDGPAQGYDVAYDLEIDLWGNLYVTGMSDESGTFSNFDYATVKYFPNGDTAWVRRYDGPENNFDEARALAVDDSGNAYVTGYSNKTETNFDYLTIKYYSNGDTAWVRRYDGEGYWPDMALAVDSKGNVYVTGSLYGSESNRDYTTVKYSPDGELAWVRRYNGTGDSDDYAEDLVLDNSDNVYVTGYSMNSIGTYDLVTVKYSSDGSCYCTRRYDRGTAGWGPPIFADLAVDSSQNVYVTGVPGGTPDYLTIKYYPIILVGDVNSDGSLNVSDLIHLINYLFKGGPAPNPVGLADLNDDGNIYLNDVVYLINYLFKGGPPPNC